MKSFAKVSMRIFAVLMVLVVLSSFAISCGLPIAAEGVQQISAESEADIPNVSGDNATRAEDNDFMMVMAVVMVVFSLLVLAAFGVLGYWLTKSL